MGPAVKQLSLSSSGGCGRFFSFTVECWGEWKFHPWCSFSASAGSSRVFSLRSKGPYEARVPAGTAEQPEINVVWR